MRDEDKYEQEQGQLPCKFEGTDACDHCNVKCPNEQIIKANNQ